MRKKNKARISKYKKKGGNNENNVNKFNYSASSASSEDSTGSTDSKGSTSSTGSTGSASVPPSKKNEKSSVASGKSNAVVPSTSIFNKLSSSFKNFSFSNSFSNVTSGFNNTMKRWFSSKPADKKVTGGRTRKSRN
jgi:hypothetical protein